MKFLPTLAPRTTVSEDGSVLIRPGTAGNWEIVSTVMDEIVGTEPTEAKAQKVGRAYVRALRYATSLQAALEGDPHGLR